MAGETILVVDDAPVNLKLAAVVLRGEGYKVHLACSAEEALMTLRTMVPDLLLVDIQLPGMNGLELTRRLRQDSRTRQMLIVALTASVMGEVQQEAFDAGCDGFIAKPIDTRSLGQRLRSFLEGRQPAAAPTPAAAPAPDVEEGGLPTGLSLSGPEMDGLRRSFLADGSRQVRRLLEFVHARFDIGDATRMFHQWVGSAGALGYMELAGQARAAETLLTTPGWTQSDLHDALSALAYAFASPREASDTPIPDSIVQELTRQRIALIGFADEEAERICGAFERVHALPRLFAGDEPPESDSLRDCSVAMVHVRPDTLGIPWLQPGFAPTCPLVLVGGREDLLGLPVEVQSRACEFLIDGWQPEEVIMRLSFALARGVPRPANGAGASPAAAEPGLPSLSGKPEIVVADDDPNVLAIVRNTLQSLGMECRSAANGSDALSMIRALCPHAAVLDVNMPGMDGFAVLAAIREAALPVKVILLTARQQERDVLRGFELGADDYVVKPFNPLELAARLKRCL
jgi:two-component system, cell cycle response regulator DivK